MKLSQGEMIIIDQFRKRMIDVDGVRNFWGDKSDFFWMSVLREEGNLYHALPEWFKNNPRLHLEAAKTAYLSYAFLKKASEELKLMALMRSESASFEGNLPNEYQLLKCPNPIFRERKDLDLSPSIVNKWNDSQGAWGTKHYREIEYDVMTDSYGVEEYDPIDFFVLNHEVVGPEQQFPISDLINLIEEDPKILFLLRNREKPFRLCRYANRLNPETRLSNPYLALEIVASDGF